MCVYENVYICTCICICVYIYEKKSVRGPGAFGALNFSSDSVPSTGRLSRSSLGHFSALNRVPDRSPARERATLPTWTARPGPKRDRRQARTARRGLESRPGQPQEAPRAAQDRPLRPKMSPGPPTEALRAAQDRSQRPRERPKTVHSGLTSS